MHKQDNTDYKPDALMEMVMSAMRACSAAAQDRVPTIKAAPSLQTDPEGLYTAQQPQNSCQHSMKQLRKRNRSVHATGSLKEACGQPPLACWHAIYPLA
jgi:hypothetical protein